MSETTRLSGQARTYGSIARWACLLLLGAGLMVSGCATASLTIARDAFYSGNVAGAAQALTDEEKVRSRDRLLYYMEKGGILHYSGNYQDSADVLFKAADLMKEQDIISASQQVTSLVTNEWMTDYKGEYAERLLVHTFQMMNFLILGKNDDALVEAKQALQVYEAHPESCDNDYFTRALIAHCYETLGEINGAYIEYKKLAELMGDPSPVARELCDLGTRLGFDDEVAHYSQFLTQPSDDKKKRPVGEAIIFLSRGRAPVKVPQDIVIPPSIRFSFSTYEDRSGYFPGPDVGPMSGPKVEERVTTDVGTVLRTSLSKRLARIIAKETARVVAKEAIANNINNSGAEALVRIAFLLTEVPDTRCWQTLPAYMTLIRIPLYPGEEPAFLKNLGESRPLPAADGAPPGNRPFYRYYSIRH